MRIITRNDTHMKASGSHKYGSPDAPKLKKIKAPTVEGDEVLFKVHAASTNPGDLHLLRVEQVFLRLTGFWF